MPRLTSSELRMLGVAIFERLGASQGDAALVIDTLIDANLVGHDSHGIIYITRYAERIRKGIIDPNQKPQVTNESPSTAIVDGNWTFGQVTAKKTMEVAIEKAKKSSISAVGAFHCNHIGRLGAYTMMAAENDMIGFLMANSSHLTVQPYGGASPVLGTNPISVAIPSEKMKPFLLDFATSAVAEGKIWLAAVNGVKVPLGWIVDKNGNDTDNPLDFSMLGKPVSGRLRTFGARDSHKGYCLSILIEILGGILTGAGSVIDGENVHPNENGLLAIVMDIQRFKSTEAFKKRVDSLFTIIHKEPVDPRSQNSHVQVPGEFEWLNRERNLKDGINVPNMVWDQIVNLAEELGIDVKNPH